MLRVPAFLLFALLPVFAQWQRKLGDDPVFAQTVDRYLKSAAQQAAQLPDPTKPPARDTWQPLSDTCSALVNVYRLSGETVYRDQARRIADWLLASNDYLTQHRDPQLPYLGWGPERRTGYFQCHDVSSYHADDLWDTVSVTRCLLKVAEVEGTPAKSRYFERAKKIADEWPYVDRTLPSDGPYAAAGLRWYRKSTEPCENRYVKNTNIAMGEQLFRIFAVTGAPADLSRAIEVLHTQLWDILTHRNLAYTSYMTYLDHSDATYSEQAAHNDRKVRRDGEGALRCGDRDASCWNHLGYEGYAMFNIQQLTREMPAARFPVPGTKDDIARTVRVTMDAWHGSRFGDAARFDWSGPDSATHVLAYNCALRFSADPSFDRQCREGLRHRNTSATLFYALVPESLFPAAAH
ncbi:MAG: hypothetical protein JWP63_4459 [Candidatus Solibacter sp.]|jgi:hypothetical protein|nr:hypothetical protein [Candidatus Solibacter sp.]